MSWSVYGVLLECGVLPSGVGVPVGTAGVANRSGLYCGHPEGEEGVGQSRGEDAREDSVWGCLQGAR